MLAKEDEQGGEAFSFRKPLYNSLEKIFRNPNLGRRIVIEGSEPLIHIVPEIIATLKSKYQKLFENKEIIINRDQRFGACDIDIPSYLGGLYGEVDTIIHLGHNPFPNTFESIRKLPFKVYFVPVFEEANMDPHLLHMLDNYLARYREIQIYVIYSIQYMKQAYEISRFLLKNGYRVSIPKIKGLLHGQILGCLNHLLQTKISNNPVLYLVVSSGLFHALGVGIYSGRKVIKVDPFYRKIDEMDSYIRKYRSLIAWNLFKAEKYDKYALIVVKDSHQPLIGGYKYVKKLLDLNKKKYTTYFVSRISEDIINNLPPDELPVIAGCPRIAIDDITRFNRPVINMEQLQILFGIKSFDEVYPSYNV